MQPLYQLTSESLLPGDVILESGEGVFSAAIRWIDGGEFSHALIYLGTNLIAEAIESGVRTIQASRILAKDVSRYRILRHPNRASVERAQTRMMSFIQDSLLPFLHSEIHKPYGWMGVFGTKIPFLKSAPHQFFCSQLVAEAYRRIDVPLFRKTVPPTQVTPNMLASDDCLLETVNGGFTRLPDFGWLQEFSKDRYNILKEQPYSLIELTHQIATEIVELFGSRVDAATKKINKVQTIRSISDLYLTLYFPDLPDGDKISDELVLFMELNYPSTAIERFMKDSKDAFKMGLNTQDQQLISFAIASLERDIDSVSKLLPTFEAQLTWLRSIPDPPLKKRSIHLWLEEQTEKYLEIETEFLEWRKEILESLVRRNMHVIVHP